MNQFAVTAPCYRLLPQLYQNDLELSVYSNHIVTNDILSKCMTVKIKRIENSEKLQTIYSPGASDIFLSIILTLTITGLVTVSCRTSVERVVPKTRQKTFKFQSF